MKRIFSTFLALCLLLSLTAMAAAPVDIVRQSLNGNEYIVKTFELPSGSDPAALIESDFVQDGFSFAHHTTTAEDITATITQAVIEVQTVESERGALEDVLKKLPSTLPYDRDGFTGTLILDTGSVSTEVAGYTTTTSSVSTIKTYPALMYQDPSSIPQTALKNGVELPLSDVAWTVTGTSLAGDSLVPTEFMATATYAKRVSSKVPTGYISTANYTGEVNKTEVTAVVYTLTYLGTPLPTPEPEPLPIPEPEPFPWGLLMTGLAVLLLLGGGVMALVYLKSSQGVAVYNLVEDDYLCIGRQRLDYKKPVIDLNEFGDSVQSRFFSFVLDRASTRRLFGRNIAVTLGDITMTHRVKEMEGKYRFNLEMGVEL